MHKIRTEVGDPVRAAECELCSLIADLATQRDEWAATHTLKDANPRERRIIRGREELTAAGEWAGATR